MRKEEADWVGFEPEMSQIQFEISDLIFDEQVEDLARSMARS